MPPFLSHFFPIGIQRQFFRRPFLFPWSSVVLSLTLSEAASQRRVERSGFRSSLPKHRIVLGTWLPWELVADHNSVRADSHIAHCGSAPIRRSGLLCSTEHLSALPSTCPMGGPLKLGWVACSL
ncbi:hypothetical protein BCV70DRAFT_117586 [Testicularia cyperi]|uniref:Uncharacterized protein n=1 Tax=Testicularia cyperi TaxID=1882483 RepID=A0A317XMS8_9BASI|nr:hypothetical protein BCV70DRAFT_117586 [Testicularia cyperi]